jgi:hypothetical protein
VVAHELIHAAAGWLPESETGVPQRCESHNGWNSSCSDILRQIARELDAEREEKRKEDKKKKKEETK